EADLARMGRTEALLDLPGAASTSRCKGCGAEILWCRTASGKVMPLDPDPVEGGNVALDPGQGLARVLRQGEAWHGLRYRSHFASCSASASFRRPRQKGNRA